MTTGPISDPLAALAQVAVLIAALAVSTPLVGRWLAHTYTSPRHLAVERGLYRMLRLDPDADQHWRGYLTAVLGFSLAGILLLTLLARAQAWLPGSIGMAGMPADGAWNAAVSFVTNTNWQWFSGEAAAGHLLQMAGFTVQNFVSAATGMAVAAAVARGLAREEAGGRIGNFGVDLVRGVVRVLLPLAFVLAVVLVLLGVIQNFHGPQSLGGGAGQLLGGPVASQEAIKEVGTNGGGFFNANSAHPFENPTPLTNLLEVFALLMIPFAMAWAFGLIVGDRRQGGAVLAAMSTLLVASIGLLTWAEMAGGGTSPAAAGAALEGKEMRFGEAGSALFAAATTGTSTGAVNSMHDSFTASGGAVAMVNMLLGEVAPGGVGSGLYGMLVLAVVTVFLAGLMVGRTPTYLGKKIGAAQIRLVAGYVLLMPALVLVATAVSVVVSPGLAGLQESGPHGLSEALYAVASASNNNGSAFAGLTSGTGYWNVVLGLCMLLGRFVPIVLVLALAGGLSTQRRRPDGPGSMPTHTPVFVGLLVVVTLVVSGLTFVPVLTLGPIVEALS